MRQTRVVRRKNWRNLFLGAEQIHISGQIGFSSAALRGRKKERRNKKSYLKIDESVFVHVERAENVVAEFFGVAAGEEHLVHVDELGRRQLSVRTVLLQTKTSGRSQKVQHTK